MKRRGCLLALLLCCSLAGMAQEDNTLDMSEELDDMDQFLEEANRDFDNFLEEADKDFIRFLEEPWKEIEAEQPIVKRTKPEPAMAPVCDEQARSRNEEPQSLAIREVSDLNRIGMAEETDESFSGNPTETVMGQRQKKESIVSIRKDDSALQELLEQAIQEEVSEEENLLPSGTTPLYAGGKDRVEIRFAGQTFHVNGNLKGCFQLKNLRESSVASAYSRLCRKTKSKRRLLQDCRQIREDLRLNDWGMFWLVETISDAFCQTKDESVVMQQFLLNELGYKSKMARKEGEEEKMMLFVATDRTVYALPYFKLSDGLCYYNLTDNRSSRFYICERSSAKARRSVSLGLTSTPNFAGGRVRTTRRTENGQMEASAEVSGRLMEFYRQIPSCDYSVYVTAPVNEEVEATLLASLKSGIEGKSETEAADMLLHYVQTAFKYATDDEQFGYEKPFFIEEMFFYPACDCEDRAIFYAYLVRKLLKLDVVLLDYPDHVATAVHFNEEVKGDFFEVDNRKYTVCDPTYIGASIGMAMSCYKKTPAGILRF